MKKGTVLTIDDDNDLQMVMEQYLEGEGYRVLKAGDVKSAGEAIETTEFDVILLDLGLPDGEGLTLIPQLKLKSDAAILVVSGKSDTTEKIVCLEMGADDYICKPFSPREVVARVKAVLRRHFLEPSSRRTGESSPISVLEEEGRALVNGEKLELTPTEFKLLKKLVSAPGRVYSRTLLHELCTSPEQNSVDRTIDSHIKNIRKKISQHLPDREVIHSVYGVGYRFEL